MTTDQVGLKGETGPFFSEIFVLSLGLHSIHPVIKKEMTVGTRHFLIKDGLMWQITELLLLALCGWDDRYEEGNRLIFIMKGLTTWVDCQALNLMG